MRRWTAGIVSGMVLCGLLTTSAAAAGGNQFSDVPRDAYYAQAVSWAVERGMATGTGEGTFSPNALCTRAQVVTMLWKAMGAQEPVRGNHFSDVPANAYYAKAATWAYEKGLVSGTTFRGDAPCLRGDIAAMLWKMAGRPSAQSGTQWNLLLVNREQKLPQGFSVALASIQGGQYQVDARCVDALEQMLADCRAAGFSPAVCSAYRTEQEQRLLFNRETARWMALGMPLTEAQRAAAKSTAVPGTSEHQTGLAVDLVDSNYWGLDEAQASMPAQKWLMEHCWEYGFILRYPSDKEAVTGIVYEPWHYRYVGLQAARTIHEQGLCLEEYLQNQAEYQSAVSWAIKQGITASESLDAFAPYDTCTRAQLVTFLHQALGEN